MLADDQGITLTPRRRQRTSDELVTDQGTGIFQTLKCLPDAERAKGKRTFRAITADGHNLEFSDGFADLHTRSYEEILAGRGFGLNDNRVAIETVAAIRNGAVVGSGEQHPLVAKKR